MFEDDRGRLLQIGEWLGDIAKGLSDPNPVADEVLPWRLSRIEQSRTGLSASYLAKNPELSRLGLPDLDRALAALMADGLPRPAPTPRHRPLDAGAERYGLGVAATTVRVAGFLVKEALSPARVKVR